MKPDPYSEGERPTEGGLVGPEGDHVPSTMFSVHGVGATKNFIFKRHGEVGASRLENSRIRSLGLFRPLCTLRFSRYKILLDVSHPLCRASLQPRVRLSMTSSPSPKKTSKKPRLHDEPVVLEADEEIDHSSVPVLPTPLGPVPMSDRNDAGGSVGTVVGAARKPLTSSQGPAELSGTEKAWGPIVADGLKAAEAATQRSAVDLGDAFPPTLEPEGTIGSLEVRAVTLDVPLSSDWAV